MALSAGIAKSCGALNGGIKRLGIASASGIDLAVDFAWTTGEITTAPTKFYEFEFEIDTAELRENGEMTNGVAIYNHEVEFYLRGNNTALRTALNELQDNCGFVIAVEDMNSNIYFMGVSEALGLDYPAKLASDATTSGKDLTDLTGSTITLACRSTEKMNLSNGLTFDALLV